MGIQIPHGKGNIVTYLRISKSAFRIVRLQLQANVPAQRTRWTSAFTAARGDNTAMRPFAILLWTLVIIRLFYVCFMCYCILRNFVLFFGLYACTVLLGFCRNN